MWIRLYQADAYLVFEPTKTFLNLLDTTNWALAEVSQPYWTLLSTSELSQLSQTPKSEKSIFHKFLRYPIITVQNSFER